MRFPSLVPLYHYLSTFFEREGAVGLSSELRARIGQAVRSFSNVEYSDSPQDAIASLTLSRPELAENFKSRGPWVILPTDRGTPQLHGHAFNDA